MKLTFISCTIALALFCTGCDDDTEDVYVDYEIEVECFEELKEVENPVDGSPQYIYIKRC